MTQFNSTYLTFQSIQNYGYSTMALGEEGGGQEPPSAITMAYPEGGVAPPIQQPPEAITMAFPEGGVAPPQPMPWPQPGQFPSYPGMIGPPIQFPFPGQGDWPSPGGFPSYPGTIGPPVQIGEVPQSSPYEFNMFPMFTSGKPLETPQTGQNTSNSFNMFPYFTSNKTEETDVEPEQSKTVFAEIKEKFLEKLNRISPVELNQYYK